MSRAVRFAEHICAHIPRTRRGKLRYTGNLVDVCHPGILFTAAGSSQANNESQVTAMKNMVNTGVQGILVTPSDTRAIASAGALRYNGFLEGFGTAEDAPKIARLFTVLRLLK